MSAEPHLAGLAGPQGIDLQGGHLRYWPSFLAPKDADRFLEGLWRDATWSQHFVHIAGRRIPSPRLSAWYGVDGARYTYSGQTYDPLPLFPLLEEVRRAVEKAAGTAFNSVLLNGYRDGSDSMGWHSDAERELGSQPVIASLSLGATRRFRMRHRSAGVDPVQLDLPHGSLLVMDGDTQTHWRHAVPKTRRQVGLRLNLTFRRIENAGEE